MTPHERLCDVFDRGMEHGVHSLSQIDRELYRIQDFIIDYEMGGLSGYFYNRLPDLKGVQLAIAAVRKHGLTALAELLNEAADLFEGYIDPQPASTWSETLRKYDPSGKLNELDKRIAVLGDYGVEQSAIR